MYTASFSLSDLSGFIERQINEGLLNPSTGQARKYACELILGALSAEEQRDISRVDITRAYERFVSLSGTQISVQTLETYKSRVERTMEEMKQWKKDPEAYAVRARQAMANKVERTIRRSPLMEMAMSDSSGSLSALAAYSEYLYGEPNSARTTKTPPIYNEPNSALALARSAPQRTSNTLPAVPVAIRDNCVVQVLGLPVDLTRQEVQRILKVIEAYAV